MPSLREEITKTFTRLTRFGDARAYERRMQALPDTREGKQFGAYKIIRRLGVGGMGQIYLALDTRLGRHVALKFLAPELISDEVSLLRLVQEARAASALNHPNILTIYDVGQLEGEHFIVSEYVEGVTLRSAMERDLVNPYTAIDIAAQVASALSAAHAAGVIHRDLKPTNIMLRPDGYVKVIDFGLAKRLLQSAGETMTRGRDLTRSGTTLGTADYMSPEQARGEEVDGRTDVWSLGVILYEMLAGRRPFEGPTHSHVMVAIQDHPAPMLPADKSLPAGLQGVISRALAKKVKDRYAGAGEMAAALQAVAGVSSTSGSRVRIAIPARRVNFGRIALICAAVLLVAAGGYLWRRWRQPQWLHLEPVRQLTFNGRTQLDALSPDGKYLAYTVGQPDGQQALYLKQLDSPTDELKIPPRKINYYGLTFSPDNQTLYVVEKDETLMGRLYAVPLLGTRPSNPIVVDVDGPISFSPDGARFVYVQYVPSANNTVSHLMLASRDGQNRRLFLSTSDDIIFRQPDWSPDGKRIAVFLEGRGRAGRAFLDLVGLDGSESRRGIADWRGIGHPRWTADGKSLIVGGIRTYGEPGRRYQLHQLSVIDGRDRLLTGDLAAYTEVSLSADGRELTAVKTDSKAVVWISKPNDFKHGDTVPAEAELNPSLAWVDSGHLIVDSRRNGFPNVALLDSQTLSFGNLTNEQFVEQDATVVPGSGGKSVVFASNRAGYFHIWHFDADANRFQQLSSGTTYDQQPSVSPDGRWVVYTSWMQNVPRLRKVPVIGGASVSVGSFNAQNPQISPDGKWIACYLQNPATGKWITAIIPFDSAGAPREVPGASSQFRWSPDGNSILSVRTSSNGVSNVWRIPLNGGDPVSLTEFEDQSILSFALSPTGERLACLRAIVGADVMLFKTGA